MDGNTDILIIGGGMAGLSAATALAGTGARIIVLDKGRGPGGRMAARRVVIAGEQVSIDHGAQYFTARDPAFRTTIAAWEQAGVAARWPAAGEDAWVGTPGMNACVRHMAASLDMRWNVRAERLSREGALWRVAAGEEAFTAHTVLVAVPAEQAAVLLADVAPAMAARAAGVTSAPCWAVMAGFAAPVGYAPDTFRADGPISWAARNSAKPKRAGVETWVIHASPQRSRELIDLPKDEVAALLLADFFAATDTAPAEPQHLDAHRWLYAQPEVRKSEGPLFDAGLQIGIAGDWLHSPRVEGAWLSGRMLAEAVLQERLASTS
ncbi:NAD(P)/FAD-dependent oxidoreductase [Erythrobacter colymbi]|uniref:NAD(P)/FAD-dependent oxidoreductase n=1 Tax=Erythrobacter colymbi TaxID=1161202 RepID=UPI000A3773C6|nr:FAD-dependent oxidoreductase [Erythrobacter colymbi]